MKHKIHPIAVFIFAASFFFFPILSGKLPIPSDTIIGLYHPFRDLYKEQYPNGIPYKNFLITDPVRQQLPWRYLAIELEKKTQLPLWNPYSATGMPLLGNYQSAPFYPLNVFFFFLPFDTSWTLLVIIQPFLAGVFLFAYLRYKNLNNPACLLGSLTFAFCGFSIAWLEWNTVLQVALWLPLILLAIDHLLIKISLKWSIIFLFSGVSQIFAGHLQTLFYSTVITAAYSIFRVIHTHRESGSGQSFFLYCYKKFTSLILLGGILSIITLVQWIPLIQFINFSARNIDQANWQQEGWFIPWQHLIQFIVPDFFGNPATLNYWGIWNYGEFIGYVGIVSLVFALFALFFRRDKKTFFFGTLFFISLIFSLPTLFAKIPFFINIPFLSTAQPTRLLFVTDFSLSILAALGLDLLAKKNKGIFYPLIFVGFLFSALWIFTLTGEKLIHLPIANILTAKRNLIFPTAIYGVLFFLILAMIKFSKKQRTNTIIYSAIIVVAIFDLLRFGGKFTPFTDKKYLFPGTNALSFLQKNLGNYRIMTTDDRILPPNFSIMYRLQSIDVYDPLYIKRYAELIVALERGRPEVSPPFGFNRIVSPKNYKSGIIDLMGVKYVLSLSDISSSKLTKVFQEGQTRIYENKNVFPRAFFVKNVKLASSKQDVIETMFKENFELRTSAIFESAGPGYNTPLFGDDLPDGKAEIVSYTENKIVIETEISSEGYLVLTDTYYPTWKTKIYLEGKEVPESSPFAKSLRENGTLILRTNYNFRGILVPPGKNRIEFYNSLF